MLDISRSERYFILTLLVSGTLFLTFSYFQKVTPFHKIGTIKVEERRIAININTATLAELERLPGIGPVLAEEVILYRQKSSGFKNIEEIKNIKGIGDKKFEKIKDIIIISE